MDGIGRMLTWLLVRSSWAVRCILHADAGAAGCWEAALVPIRLHASDDESSHLAFWHDFWADTALRRQQAFCRQPAPELV
eukprot:COSAG01_NODE_15086_length_1376_cov_2.019577_1_plen_79_part_10